MTSTIEAPRIVIVEELCKGCGICVEFCPLKILETCNQMTSKGTYPPRIVEAGKCTGCRICQHYCPDFAIFVVGRSESSRS